ATIIDPAMVHIEWRTAEILMNSDGKRQMHIQAKAMLVRIDLDHPKRQLQMNDSKAGLAADPLSDDRRSGRIDAANSHIERASPDGRLHEKRPHDIDRPIDHGGGTAPIPHR